MKIALIGYGKMGKAIERIALGRGHEIVCIADVDSRGVIGSETFRSADVAIEFTTPSTAAGNIRLSAAAGVPVVCGTTGWYQDYEAVASDVRESGSALLAATNFSIGVYVTRMASRLLASVMGRLPQYRGTLDETHHIHKLDYPSGTAVTMADEIVASDEALGRWVCAGEVWEDSADGPRQAEEALLRAGEMGLDTLPVTARRRGEVPGIHTVTWDSEVDTVTLSHSAKSRGGFALGAVMAAEWLAGRKGVYTIDDMMHEILGK
ncbi:MAG: 4-hydroxy-tetrahydrodipicolinate reductase [Duncaniella sp.]|nr:4-hydroxy-tetrahydrodipicolinate reductase [Duncaniella sp.]